LKYGDGSFVKLHRGIAGGQKGMLLKQPTVGKLLVVMELGEKCGKVQNVK
jgi:hypothetical protein